MVRTHIGYGSPNKQDTAEAHGSPLGEEEVKLTKENLGWPLEPKFYVPEEALAHFRKAIERGEKAEAEWQTRLADYRKALSGSRGGMGSLCQGELAPGWTAKIPTFSSHDKPMATRQASGKVLNAISPVLPTLLGGSADLAPSTNTLIKGEGDFEQGELRRAQLPLRRARTRHGRNHQWHGAERADSLWRDVLRLFGLSAARFAPGGADGSPFDLCLHP